MLLIRCDDKAFKKLMSNFGSSRSEESCSAVVELLERVTRLHKQLELKESRAEIDMYQVQTTPDLTLHQGGVLDCCSIVLPGPGLPEPSLRNCVLSGQYSALALYHKSFMWLCVRC